MAEKEYIDRAALYDKCKRLGLGCGSVLGRHSGAVEELLDYIQNEPAADVVEVVRCKDCKHFHAVETGMFCDKYVSIHDASRNPQDFCSFAERKEPKNE